LYNIVEKTVLQVIINNYIWIWFIIKLVSKNSY